MKKGHLLFIRSAAWVLATSSAAGVFTASATTPAAGAKTTSFFDAHKSERKAKLLECREKGISDMGDSPAIRECNAARTSLAIERAKLQESIAKANFEVSQAKSAIAWGKLDAKRDTGSAKEEADLAKAEVKLKGLRLQLQELDQGGVQR